MNASRPTGRIVLLGATGFTGGLTARSLFRTGRRPVLAGRSAEKLAALAADLAPAYGEVQTSVVDATEVGAVGRLVGPGDVLVTTVGPFRRFGRAAVDAAVAAGATYIDSSGEPGFLREVFDRDGARARAAGAVLLPAFGYDYVPGNLAAGLAVAAAPAPVTRVDVGYFMSGPAPRRLTSAASSGTMASLLGAMGEPGYTFRAGRLETEVMGCRLATFGVGGKRRPGLNVGATEHLSLPRVFPGLQEVGVYLGWFGPVTRLLQGLSRVSPGPGSASRSGQLQAKGRVRLARRFEARSGRGPSAEHMAVVGSQVVAVAYDPTGRVVGRGELAGANPYLFTADMLAWAAGRAADGRLDGPGVLGPLEAFGLADLLDGVGASGLRQVG